MIAKVHWIASQAAGRIKTACGREAFQCRGFEPREGDPGEFDTAICDRIHATTFPDDVTCGACKRRKR